MVAEQCLGSPGDGNAMQYATGLSISAQLHVKATDLPMQVHTPSKGGGPLRVQPPHLALSRRFDSAVSAGALGANCESCIRSQRLSSAACLWLVQRQARLDREPSSARQPDKITLL